MLRWGIVATILAPTADILRFAAFHLDAGAHRLYIYLDDPDADAYSPLKAHPKIRVQKCDAAYWAKNDGKRPAKHQVRQSKNATHAYHRKTELEWLIHMDVDEFIVSDRDIGTVLYDLPDNKLCARLRPMEQLVGSGNTFKAFIPNGPKRIPIVQDIYPEFGKYVKGGFLSHVAGKVFVRTDQENINLRIHNVFQGETSNPQQVNLPNMDLAHCHAKPWTEWLEFFRYRLDKGSYRSELTPAVDGELSLHDLFRNLLEAEGDAGLKRFYDEIAMDSPSLQERLKAHNLLRHADLDLDVKLARQFPDFT
ncbi:MAG: hypothetical protein ACI9PU_000445 [Ascidiaceihabitans sp.]|jgi:hypothetical protein|tara:strand:+ start:2539 stop:3462 length:924 start_codon:yes stop_codon:yes gene_type:complete